MYDEKLLDLIKEVINIGLGEAANSLSKLVNTRVIIKVPVIHIIEASDIQAHILKELGEVGVYISQNFKELFKGKTILFYTKKCCISLLNAISGHKTGTLSLSESEIANLNEIGNIIMGSCMCEIGDVLEGRISFDVPEVSMGISENYFQNLLKEMKTSDKAILVKNEMRIKETDIQGYFFILLSFEDFNRVVAVLQKKVERV
jgi:chemotaxis protein CheC